MKKIIIILLSSVCFIVSAQDLTIDNNYTSFEILPSGIVTKNGTVNISSNTLMGKKPQTSGWSNNAQNNVGFGSGYLSFNIDGRDNVAIGNISLYKNTTGNENISLGNQNMTNNTSGSKNIGLGYQILYQNETGNRNIAIGYAVNNQSVSSSDNIAIGENALNSPALFGADNIGIGNEALSSLSSGTNNIGLGSQSLASNTTGSYNIGIGRWSLSANTTGEGNIALGEALMQNTTGSYNIGIGHRSSHKSSSSSKNIAIGEYALYENQASGNIGIAPFSLYKNTTGTKNIGVGYTSLYNCTSGNRNVAIGINSASDITNQSYNTAIGQLSLEKATSSYNTAFGYAAGRNHIRNDHNIFIGAFADDQSTNKDITNSAAIGYGAKVSSNNTYVLGNSGISSIGGYANWTNFSDRRLKDDIVYKNNIGLAFINDLKTAQYSYKADTTGRVLDGLIAQDVQASLEKLGLEWSGLVELDDEDKTLTIAYNQLTIPLINATQELKTKLDLVKEMISDLEAENAALVTLNEQYNHLIETRTVLKTTK